MYRKDLLEILDAGLGAADGRRNVREFLCDQRPVGPVHLIAIGKSAPAMTLGALEALGDDVSDGFVVTRPGYAGAELGTVPRLQVLESAHPVPDARSIRAGQALLAYAGSLAPGAAVVVLISGGASSLVEVLPPWVDPGDLSRLNRWLLASGLDILSINAVRRRLSRIKDGGLACALWGHPVLALYLSDVEGDDPAWIGSGLLRRAAAPLPRDLPDWVFGLVRRENVADSPTARVEHHVIVNLETALTACETRGRSLGYPVSRHREWLKGPVTGAAERIVAGLDTGAAGIHLWGGETTVTLPASPGRGGRNQHLALCCAVAIDRREDLAVLCAASDGTDGNSDDAGALVDGGTVQRGVDGGADVDRCLAAADSATFLEAAGDLIYTGPTTTNVNDMVIGLRIGPG